MRNVWMSLLLMTVGLHGSSHAQTVQLLKSDEKVLMERFLQQLNESNGGEIDETFRYLAANVVLQDGGEPVTILYVEAQNWCGSGGCPLIVLERRNGAFHEQTETTVTRLPIRVLRQTTRGWHDLAVNVGGGGIVEGYEVALKFGGVRYPTNPTLQARHIPRTNDGITVFTIADKPIPLYR